MEKRYYKEYYTLEREHWWFKVRAHIIEDFLKRRINTQQPLKILNVGVATGSTTEMLAKYGTVTSVEYDADCCLFLKEELGIDAINASVEALPFASEEFDLVCAFDVIEHVKNDAKAVEEMKRVCKPRGNVFITVPALEILWNRHDEVNHHQRRYTKSGIKGLFGIEKGTQEFFTYFNSLLFFPILVYRSLARMFQNPKAKEHSGSDFGVLKNNPVNTVFSAIFGLEIFWLRFARFPIGVSIMYCWKKKI